MNNCVIIYHLIKCTKLLCSFPKCSSYFSHCITIPRKPELPLPVSPVSLIITSISSLLKYYILFPLHVLEESQKPLSLPSLLNSLTPLLASRLIVFTGTTVILICFAFPVFLCTPTQAY